MMHRQELLNRFYFNDYRVVYQQIEAVSIVQKQAIIEDRHDLLGADAKPGVPQLMRQTRAIHALEKAWTDF